MTKVKKTCIQRADFDILGVIGRGTFSEVGCTMKSLAAPPLQPALMLLLLLSALLGCRLQ